MNIVFSPAFFVYAELWEVVGQRQNADAQFSQALKYICRGTQTAMTKAFVLLKRSASRGFTEAQFAAGWCCEYGCGTKLSYWQAIRWYKRAENNVTADVMNAYDPVGEDENARLQLYFTCASYAAAADCLMDMREREDSFASDFDSAAGGDAIGMLRLGHRLYYVTACRPPCGTSVPQTPAATRPCCVWPGWLRKKGVTERLQGGIAGMPQTVSTGEIGG